MSMENVAKLIPMATNLLRLGIYNKVAVREVDQRGQYQKDDNPVEALTFYRKVLIDNQFVTQTLHIFFKGDLNKLNVYAFVGSHLNKGMVTMGCNWIYVTDYPDKFKRLSVSDNCISFEELPLFITDLFNKVQQVLNITPNTRVYTHFDETVNYLESLYKNEKADLDMMSVHISSTTLSFSITCETGWGNDYHFNVTKDGQSVAMKIDICPIEVFEGDSKTYRQTNLTKSREIASIYEEFTELMAEHGLVSIRNQ